MLCLLWMTASQSAWANERFASNDPAARSESVQSWRMNVTHSSTRTRAGPKSSNRPAQDVRARTRAALVRLPKALISGRSTELPGELAPERAHLNAVIDAWLRGREGGSDKDYALDGRDLGYPRLRQDRLDAGEFRRVCAGHEVVEREHRVRLAAAEVGLEIDDRLALRFAREALECYTEKVRETGGQEGAFEEGAGIEILGGPHSSGDLAEIGGELRLGVSAGCDVRVGLDDLAPWSQPCNSGALDREGNLALRLLLGRRLPRGAKDFGAHPRERRRLIRGADRGSEARHRVERTLGVCRREGTVRRRMRPAVADLLELADVVALGLPERLAEHRAPMVRHRAEQEVGIGKLVPLPLPVRSTDWRSSTSHHWGP